MEISDDAAWDSMYNTALKAVVVQTSYGLDQEDDVNLVHWVASIMDRNGDLHSLKMECSPEYPQRPPKVYFSPRIENKHVMADGQVSTSFWMIKDWNASYSI